MESFARRLDRLVQEKASCLIAGIDPVLERLPPEILSAVGAYRPMDADSGRGHAARGAAAIALFSREVVRAVAPHVVAVKPNAAFFERFGPAGYDALVQTCREARKAGLLVILDAKRGDLESTARAYADATLGDLDDTPGHVVDATTVNPYFGLDGIRPFLEVACEHGKGVFILVRTSNPTAGEFQDLLCEGRPLYRHVAEAVARWSEGLVEPDGLSPVGAVVGATAPEQTAAVREILPHSVFLVPGFGAQGAGAESIRPHFLPEGRGAIVNASRSIIYAYETRSDGPWTGAVARAASEAREQLEAVRTGT